MNKNSISAFIISGGKSSRMGLDKATLLLKNVSFLDRILHPLNQLNIPTKIVSNNKEHRKFGIEIIEDIIPNMGPVAGIASALSNTKTDLNLILSCDVPLMNSECLEWIVESHDQKFDASVVVVNNKKMPLAGVYTKNCKSIFLQHLEERKLKLLSVLDELKVNYINCPKHLERCFLNINTKENFKQIINEM